MKQDAIRDYANLLIEQYDVRSGQGPITVVRSMSGEMCIRDRSYTLARDHCTASASSFMAEVITVGEDVYKRQGVDNVPWKGLYSLAHGRDNGLGLRGAQCAGDKISLHVNDHQQRLHKMCIRDRCHVQCPRRRDRLHRRYRRQRPEREMCIRDRAKVYDNTFSEIGGVATSLGVETDAVGLPTETWSMTNFTVEQYEALYQQVKDGTLTVDDNYDNLEQEYSNLTLNII